MSITTPSTSPAASLHCLWEEVGKCVLAPCFPSGTWEGRVQRQYLHIAPSSHSQCLFFFFFLYSSITLGCSYLFSYRSILSLLAFVSIKTWQTLFTLKDKTEISGSCLSPGRMQPSAAGSGPKCWFALVVPSCFLCGCHQCWGRDSLKRQ